MDVHDLRGAERFTLAEAISGSYGSASITVVNLSVQGAQIEHPQPLRLGTTARLWFKRGDISVSVQGLTLWSRLSTTPDAKGKLLYRSGIRIESDQEDFAAALQALLDRNLAVLDAESLERKRQRLLERQRERTNPPGATFRVLKAAEDVPSDQVLLIQHARQRLLADPEEAKKWYNRAKFALSQNSKYVVADAIRNREDVLAVWEYLERTVDLSVIVRVFERMRQGP